MRECQSGFGQQSRGSDDKKQSQWTVHIKFRPRETAMPEISAGRHLHTLHSSPMSARMEDINGYYEVKRNPLSLVGVFPYTGRSMGLMNEPDASRIFQVYRPESELADPECIESFKLLPWVDDHTMLEGPRSTAMIPGAMSPEAKGVHGVIGQEVVFEKTPEFPAGAMFGNLKVFSRSMGSAIDDDGKVALSCGYRCRYLMTPGFFNGIPYDAVQTRIRGNHLALVAEGRMGPAVAVLDHLTFSFDAKEAVMADPKDDNKSGDADAGKTGMTLEDATKMLSEIGPMVAKLNEQVAAITAAKAAVPAEKAEEVVELDKVPEALAGMDSALKIIGANVGKLQAAVEGFAADAAAAPKRFFAEVAARDQLANDLSAHVGAFDHRDMTAAEVAKYGVEKLGLKGVPAGQERTALDGYMTAAKAQATRRVMIANTNGMDGAASGQNKTLAAYAAGKKD